MNKQEAVATAVSNVLDYGFTFAVIRRGDAYRCQMASYPIPRGWRVAEQIGVGNVHNFYN